ncbi:MAG: terpene cyclase/mutase family protein [Oscillospiraceae bacterium]|nr:terpene cyclase/mutase family protein [Oscillospiraceae bacterium]
MRAAGEMHTVDEVQGLIDGIVAYKLQTAGAGSVQDWINGPLTGGAGTTAEWYIIGITQSRGEDVSAYRNALERYLEENAVSSATSREKYALALIAAGGTSPYITETLDNSIGQQGIMSWIYGLHILNNGYTCGSYTADQVADMLLTLQYPDGGWALFGDYGDIDVTAMTLQALAPFVPYRGDVQAAADRGIAFLAERQQEDGGYKSFGTANAESTAQVLCALSALGIDCNTDPRFIKEDHTVLDGLLQYRLEDGSFSHLAGDGFNETATVQAYYSLIAYQRMCSGRSPLLVLDRRQPIAQPVTDPPQTEAIATEQQQNAVTEAPSAGTSASGSTASAAASGTTAATMATTAVSSGSVTESSSTVQSSATSSDTGTVQPETVISSPESTTSGTVTSVMQPPPENTQGVGYKPIAILAIIAAGAIVSIVLVILKKRHVKNFLFVVIVCIAGSAVVLLTDIRSAQDY